MGYQIPIADEIGTYLDGNICDPNGREYWLRLNAELVNAIPGWGGSYGRVAVDNHSAYEILPFPAIALMRLAADFGFSVNDEFPAT